MISSPDDRLDDTPNSGFGIITALVFILLIAAVITPLAIISRTQILSSAYSAKRTAFDLLAVGLSQVIYSAYIDSDIAPGWHKCEAKRTVFYVKIQDQNGLIDLNSASKNLLKTGFVALGYSDYESEILANRIEKYRSLNFVNDKSQDDITFLEKRALFENIAELNDIMPPGDPRADRIYDVFTIYNKTDSVTIAHANDVLRRRLVEADKNQFVVSGELYSAYAEIIIAEFKTDDPSGFLSKTMHTRGPGGVRAREIVQRETSFASPQSLGLENAAVQPCANGLNLLIGELG